MATQRSLCLLNSESICATGAKLLNLSRVYACSAIEYLKEISITNIFSFTAYLLFKQMSAVSFVTLAQWFSSFFNRVPISQTKRKVSVSLSPKSNVIHNQGKIQPFINQ